MLCYLSSCIRPIPLCVYAILAHNKCSASYKIHITKSYTTLNIQGFLKSLEPEHTISQEVMYQILAEEK